LIREIIEYSSSRVMGIQLERGKCPAHVVRGLGDFPTNRVVGIELRDVLLSITVFDHLTHSTPLLIVDMDNLLQPFSKVRLIRGWSDARHCFKECPAAIVSLGRARSPVRGDYLANLANESIPSPICVRRGTSDTQDPTCGNHSGHTEWPSVRKVRFHRE